MIHHGVFANCIHLSEQLELGLAALQPVHHGRWESAAETDSVRLAGLGTDSRK